MSSQASNEFKMLLLNLFGFKHTDDALSLIRSLQQINNNNKSTAKPGHLILLEHKQIYKQHIRQSMDYDIQTLIKNIKVRYDYLSN